jgi:sporulation protein YlmC with PRC-barrel domain
MVDREGRRVGRVDDIEFDDEAGSRPVMVAFLSGMPALSKRLPGRLGAFLRAAYARLHDEKDPPALRIPLAQVENINSRVDLNVAADDLDIGRLDDRIVDRFLGRIPGADLAPE